MSAAVFLEGVPCVILGRPNAGKSTLLNTLLGRERAIVTDIPGTTRDLIEENVKVGQILLRVTDTAGLRNTNDPVEQAGIDRAMAEASASSLILAVFDGSKPISDEDMLVLARSAGHRAIAVVNKVDLPQQLDEKLLKSTSCTSCRFLRKPVTDWISCSILFREPWVWETARLTVRSSPTQDRRRRWRVLPNAVKRRCMRRSPV